MKNGNLRLIPYLLIVVALFIPLSACDPGSQSPYQQFKTENDLCKFSLEYPSLYSDKGEAELNLKERYYGITFAMPQKGIKVKNPDPNNQNSQPVTMYVKPAIIDVLIGTGYKDDNAKTWIEKFIQGRKGEPGYSLIARSQVVVSGITAEYAHLTDSFMVPVRVASGEQPLKHYLLASFDYNGFIWQIKCEADSEEMQHAQADFDHVIQTFKILD